MSEQETERDGKPPVIESASATTDSELNRSGAGAYVVFAAAIALVVVLVSSVSGCVGSLFDVAAQSIEHGFEGSGHVRVIDRNQRDHDSIEELVEGISDEPVSRT